MAEGAYGRHYFSNEVIYVEVGRTGYWQTNCKDPVARNKELGVTEERAAELIAQALGRTAHYTT